MNRFADRRIWPSESARIADFCNTSSGFADFQNIADCVLDDNFGPDFGLFMSESVDRGYQTKLGSLWSFFVGLLAELLQRQVMKKNLASVAVKPCHSRLSNSANSDFNENMGGLTDLAKKKHGSADLRSPITP